jgi:methylase of polypeptide subunit release factors
LTSKTEIEAGGRRLQILHDELPAFGLPLPSDIVVGPGGASKTLLHLVPRIQIASAWDLGCGSGVQAIALATHCSEVFATDVDENALRYTEASANENGLTNITVAKGSMFEPVIGKSFDLVVSNPPFVIGQVTDLIHRESPMPADGLAEYFLENISAHLNPGGISVALLSWLETETENWEERISNWLPEDCGVWVGLRDSQTTAEYVKTWLQDAGLQADESLGTAWLNRLAEWNTQAIAFGWVVIRKPDESDGGSEAVHVVEDLRAADRLPAGNEVLQQLDLFRAANEVSAATMLYGHFRATELQNWRGSIGLSALMSAIRSRCTGEKATFQVISELAIELKIDEIDLMALVFVAIKQLLGLGLLELVPEEAE